MKHSAQWGMRDVLKSATRTFRQSKELVLVLQAEGEATRRNLEASRALADSGRRLLRRLRGADRVDDLTR
jgi:hypothetical protein